MFRSIRPYIIELLLSNRTLESSRRRSERKRTLSGKQHTVTVYVAINDPHSYLLLQCLSSFQDRFDIEYDFRTVLHKQDDMFPAPQLWDQNAFQDGVWLASLYGLDFPAEPPRHSADLSEQLTAQLLHWELQPGYLQNALSLFTAYWSNDGDQINRITSSTITARPAAYTHHLAANEKLLKDNGHYLSGMLHYGGEWYWGLNRLQYLERRLLALGVQKSGDQTIQYDLGQRVFLKHPAKPTFSPVNNQEPSLVIYWSVRSPYSYLGLVRGRQLAEHYGISLIIKPVLPMVMRRMEVPRNKSMYIARDTKREANQHGLSFGRIADPLGEGVERCYALVDYAESQGKKLDFLESCTRGAWSEGIRLETDRGLQTIVERVGLDWRIAKSKLNDEGWRVWAQDNLEELYSHDLWGVPSFTFGETKVFGQDRLDRIEDAIVRRLQLL